MASLSVLIYFPLLRDRPGNDPPTKPANCDHEVLLFNPI